jgi:hypothetical protein
MSTPVVTSKWAGTFECGGPCRRKRLIGDEFSKKALERHRKEGLTTTIRCKQCVAAAEQVERETAAAKKLSRPPAQKSDEQSNETRTCAGTCAKVLSIAAFNRNQWGKGEGKSRCRDCVEKSIQEEASNLSKSKEETIAAARKKVEDMEKTGNVPAILAAESELAAVEAEKVTGLKPVRMSAGRGRGRGGSRGGRGRGKQK